MDKAHDIRNIQVDGDILLLTVDGADHRVNLCHQSTRLASESQHRRANFVVSASGYGIHWPDLDEDLSVDGMIGIKHPSPLFEAHA
ncbi:MAG: DUF2442 domain-containing protein [Candidatus Latescibacterota bacterium]